MKMLGSRPKVAQLPRSSRQRCGLVRVVVVRERRKQVMTVWGLLVYATWVPPNRNSVAKGPGRPQKQPGEDGRLRTIIYANTAVYGLLILGLECFQTGTGGHCSGNATREKGQEPERARLSRKVAPPAAGGLPRNSHHATAEPRTAS